MIEIRVPKVVGLTVPDDLPPAVAPSVERLRRASTAYERSGRAIRELEVERDAAAAAHRAAAADAVLAGHRPPHPSAVGIEQRLAKARRQLDVVEAACVAGAEALLAAVNDAATGWLVERHEQPTWLADDVHIFFASLVESVERLNDVESAIAWASGVVNEPLHLERSFSGASRVSKQAKPAPSALDAGLPAALATLRAWVEQRETASASTTAVVDNDELALAVVE